MKNLSIAVLVTAALSSTFSTQTLAQDSAVGTGPNPFVDCGIGAALFPTTHWAAVSSNVIWDVGTTAVTSATMSPETCSGKKTQVSKFIFESHDVLLEETARGEGEHITAMLNIYGCEQTAHKNITQDIRKEMAVDFASNDYSQISNVEKASIYFNNLSEVVDSKFSAVCSAS